MEVNGIDVGGRPPIFETVEQLIEKINDYFNNGVKIRTVIIGKAPNNYEIQVPVPTITGLCSYIGFDSRQSFYDYEKKEGFSYTIKKARLFIEQEYEEQLQHGNTIGAIFALKNMGWKDKVETGFTNNEGEDIAAPSFTILPPKQSFNIKDGE